MFCVCKYTVVALSGSMPSLLLPSYSYDVDHGWKNGEKRSSWSLVLSSKLHKTNILTRLNKFPPNNCNAARNNNVSRRHGHRRPLALTCAAIRNIATTNQLAAKSLNRSQIAQRKPMRCFSGRSSPCNATMNQIVVVNQIPPALLYNAHEMTECYFSVPQHRGFQTKES